MDITSETCRAARALLGWSQQQLASAANVGLSTVRGFETGTTRPVPNNLMAMREALEKAGIQFIPENGGGAGVRKRKPGTAPIPHPRSVGPEDETRGGPEAPEKPARQQDD